MKLWRGIFVVLLCTCNPNNFFVKSQAMGCTSVTECIMNSTETCQEWIDRSYNFQGDCCSFQDLPDGGCQLVTVGTCSYQSGPECDPDSSVGCLGNEVVIFVDDATAECPPSDYSLSSNTEAPESTDSPAPAGNTSDESSPSPSGSLSPVPNTQVGPGMTTPESRPGQNTSDTPSAPSPAPPDNAGPAPNSTSASFGIFVGYVSFVIVVTLALVL